METFRSIFKESFLANFQTNISKGTIIATFALSFVLALYVYYVYKLTGKDVIYSKKFNVTMSLMSIITSAIVLSMQANIAVSLGMVGALSIVRFRTAIKEPRDLLFLFWSISNGIIIGSGLYAIAIILALALTIAMILFDLLPENRVPYLLVIYHDGTKSDKIEDILNENKIKFKLKSENISTTYN